jgi:GntR family transcriptional regulator/MocR family aminotransferase
MCEGWSTFGVDLHLELGASGGRRAALERVLREAIRSGRLRPGARLPSTRALAVELGLSRGTVSAAYYQLTAEGYLLPRVGSGTVVAGLTGAGQPAPGLAAAGAHAVPRYDLRPGNPDVTTFPVTAWLRSTRRALATAPAGAYNYGEPAGRIELRSALAEYLGRTRGVVASPDRIVVTSGYVQALALLTAVTVAGRTVAMEDPGMPYHREVVRRAGAEVAALPVDERGARTDQLGAGVAAAVLTPAHQYPLGATLHARRRRAAAEWADIHDGLIIEDDYDGEFRYDRQPVGAMQGIAPDRVAYVGTVSKTLGPAVRLAWVVLPERLVAPFLAAKYHADHSTGVLGQLTLADLIATHGYDRHVRAVRLRYRRRRDLLVRRLAPHGAVEGIAAGLHAVIRPPATGRSEAVLLAAAAEYGLALGGLRGHWHTADDHPDGLIIGYGTPAEGRYAAAIDQLARLLRAR